MEIGFGAGSDFRRYHGTRGTPSSLGALNEFCDPLGHIRIVFKPDMPTCRVDDEFCAPNAFFEDARCGSVAQEIEAGQVARAHFSLCVMGA